MTPSGGAVLGVTSVTMAYALWALGTLAMQTNLGQWQPLLLGNGVLGLCAGQLLAMALWLPACVERHGAWEGAGSGLLIALLPAPVLTVACLMGALSADKAITAVAAVTLAALGLIGITWSAHRVARSATGRRTAVGALQSATVVLVLTGMTYHLLWAAP